MPSVRFVAASRKSGLLVEPLADKTGTSAHMAGLDIIIATERDGEQPAIAGLEERAFGPGRFARTAFRLREGNAHDPALSFVARVSTLIVGSIRLTPIRIGAAPALLLGPLTVDPAFRSKGIGRMLITKALDAAKINGHRAVLLVGDFAYYSRSGFERVPMGRITLPGPVDPSRILVRMLHPDQTEKPAGLAAC